jgi:hypothetical protein
MSQLRSDFRAENLMSAQFSSLVSLKSCIGNFERIGRSFLVPFSTLECLDIREDRYRRPQAQTDAENNHWLELLHVNL